MSCVILIESRALFFVPGSPHAPTLGLTTWLTAWLVTQAGAEGDSPTGVRAGIMPKIGSAEARNKVRAVSTRILG